MWKAMRIVEKEKYLVVVLKTFWKLILIMIFDMKSKKKS